MITCPKCGFEQLRSPDCIRCGINFRKYVELQARRRAHDSTDSLVSKRGTRPVIGQITRAGRYNITSQVGSSRRLLVKQLSKSSVRDIYVAFGQLLHAGMSPLQACAALRESATSGVEIELGKMQQALEAGMAVPQALSAASVLFSKADLAVLTAYNETGDLAVGFQALATHANDVLDIQQTFYRGLTYPLFILVLAIIVTPLPQLFLRSAESYFVLIGTRLGALCFSLLLLIWGLKMLVSVASIRARLKSMAWVAPWPATIWTHHVRFVFHRTFTRNVDAGLELLKAITSAIASTNDPLLASRAHRLCKTVTEAGVTKLLIELGLVRQTDVVVLISGERSGALVDSLSTLAERYKVARDQGLRWLNRLVTVVASIVVLTVVSLGILDTYKQMTDRTNSILEALGSDTELDNLDPDEARDLNLDSLLLLGIERGSRGEVNREGSRR